MKKILSLLLALVLIVGTPGPLPSRAETGGKLVALTFDDGPGRDTARLLDGLKSRNVHCTFFYVGEMLERFPGIAERAYAEGHELANHSWDHPNLKRLSDERVVEELESVNRLLRPICGDGCRILVRAPGGNTTEHTREIANIPFLYWSTNTQDYIVLNAEKVADSLVETCYDGAILLLHDSHPTSVDAALAGIDRLKAQGYEFVTVSELFRRRGVPLEAGKSYVQCKPTGTDLGPVTSPWIQTKQMGTRMQVTLTAQPGTEIRYSLDGSDISGNNQLYTGPLLLDYPVTIKAAAAFSWNGSRSDTVSYTELKPVAPAPLATLDKDTLTLSSSAAGTEIRYTMDGNAPDMSSSLYTSPLTLKPGTTVRAVCGGDAYYTSEETTAVYSQEKNFFLDVVPSAWYYEDMDQAASSKILQGDGNGRFYPEDAVSRAEFVTLLWRTAKEPKPGDVENMFPDVSDSDSFATAIRWALSENLIQGSSDGNFHPSDSIRRQDMASILASFAQSKKIKSKTASTVSDYKDLESLSQAERTAIEQVTALNLMKGTDAGVFHPQAPANRAEAVAVMNRLQPMIPRRGFLQMILAFFGF